MYLDYFDLKDRPFAITPDPDFMFWSDQHRKAYETIRAEIGCGAPVTVLVGQVGTGKTHLINALMRDPEIEQKHQILLMSNMFGDTSEFLQRILLTIDRSRQGDGDMWLGISSGLARIRQSGRSPLIIADEAQTLSADGAEVLARLATDKTMGPVPMLIAGQTELGVILRRSGYRSLRRVLSKMLALPELSYEETRTYIRTRLDQAGATREIFTDDAVRIVHDRAKGIPRLINKLCDALLFLSAQEDVKLVDAASTNRILDESIDPQTLALQPNAIGLAIPAVKKKAASKPEPLILEEFKVPVHPPMPAPSAALVAIEQPLPARPRRGKWILPGLAACLASAVLFVSPLGQRLLEKIPVSLPGQEAAEARLVQLEAQKQSIEKEIAEAEARLAQTRFTERELALQTQEAATRLAQLSVQIEDEGARLELIKVQTGKSAALTSEQDTDPGGLDIAIPAALTEQQPEQSISQQPVAFREAAQDLTPNIRPIAGFPASEAEAFFADAIDMNDPQEMAVSYARAALRGHHRAALYLGQMFETGDGVTFSPVVADRWYAVAEDTVPQPGPSESSGTPFSAGSATPLFSSTSSDGTDLIWDGHSALFEVEIADADGQTIGWFETPLTAAQLDLPEKAVSWRVRSAGAGTPDWHPIDSDRSH